jgi:3-deoxy-D-manno-octulosonic acid (KDO) 8-phosphate synthase
MSNVWQTPYPKFIGMRQRYKQSIQLDHIIFALRAIQSENGLQMGTDVNRCEQFKWLAKVADVIQGDGHPQALHG